LPTELARGLLAAQRQAPKAKTQNTNRKYLIKKYSEQQKPSSDERK